MKTFHLPKILLLLLQLTSKISRGEPSDSTPSEDDSSTLFTTQPTSVNTIDDFPQIPDGEKQILLYNIDSEGSLHKQWMSLQEVQDIIISYSLNCRPIEPPKKIHLPFNAHLRETDGTMKNKYEGETWMKNQKKTETSVEDVLANIQKVMSKEITNTFLRDDILTRSKPQISSATEFTSSGYDDPATQNITVSDTILAHLMKEQVASLETRNPWGIMTQPPLIDLFSGVFLTTESDEVSTTPKTNSEEDLMNQENYLIEDVDTKAIVEAQTININSPVAETNINSRNDFSELGITSDNFMSVETTKPTTYSLRDDLVIDSSTAGYDFLDTSTVDFDNNEVLEKSTLKSEDKTDMGLEGTTTTAYQSLNLETDQMKDNIEDINNILTERNSSPSYSIIPVTKLGNGGSSFQQNENVYEISSSNDYTKSNETLLRSEISNLEQTVTTEQTSEASESVLDDLFTPNSIEQTVLRDELESKNNNNQYNYGSKHKTAASSVLSPLEIAQLPEENAVHLSNLEDMSPSDYEFDDFDLYLEDLSTIDYEYDETVSPDLHEETMSSMKLDFPSPETTNSYHKPEHVLDQDYVNPAQFLPSHNPEIAKGENPLHETPYGNEGLEATVVHLDPDIRNYVNAMNDVAFQIYRQALKVHRRQNLVMSPLNLVSSLSMLLLGARNTTADALSQLLKTEDFLMFNPHLVLRNITDSVLNLNNHGHESAFANNIFIEKPAMKPYDLTFFSRTMNYFYNAGVFQVPAEEMGTKARDEANRKIREQTSGTVRNFLKPNATLRVLGPLSLVSSCYFQCDWVHGLSERDLIDMNFIRFPSAERRLIRTVGISQNMNINAGYSKEMDATVAEIPLKSPSQDISLILVMPGQQKNFVANGLIKLESSLTSARWGKLLKSVIPHDIIFKMPIFSHRNYLNISAILSESDLKGLFQDSADFSGVSGFKNLYMGDLVQLNEFHSLKLDKNMFVSRNLKKIEETLKLPSTRQHEDKYERSQISESGPLDTQTKRQRRSKTTRDASGIPNPSGRSDRTLAYDRAFFYVLRHNPTGFILVIGRYLDPETF